ncbi:MAG: sensor histidine kinase [Proteobacteria bacterium]|nr:sensor histidine kinase [Pseudomonadota bacterium]
MREVNHRVANSLQLVNSLVGMQAAGVREPSARAALADTQARILAIARVHQRLYTGGDASCVDLKDYLQNLVGELAAAMGADERRPLNLEAAEAELSTDKAVAVGVVVAELVTNAFKYAYPDDAAGEVRVRLVKGENGVTLTVEDDGVGLPSEPQVRGTGLGMKVVRAMAATLGAKLDLTSPGPGSRVALGFQDGC